MGKISGARVVVQEKPLFCKHCDQALAKEYARRFDAGAPAKELVPLLRDRTARIVKRIWPDRWDWMCHRCARAASKPVPIRP
jgi:hypothetical protein